LTIILQFQPSNAELLNAGYFAWKEKRFVFALSSPTFSIHFFAFAWLKLGAEQALQTSAASKPLAQDVKSNRSAKPFGSFSSAMLTENHLCPLPRFDIKSGI